MPEIELDGCTVHYDVAGSGPGIVLLHGTGGNGKSCWGHLVDRFADQHTVVTPDYAGSGRTTSDSRPLSLDLLADQIMAVIEDATDRPVMIVGLCLGAVTAAATAAKYPHLVRRLALLGGWLRNDDPRQQLALSLWRQGLDDDRGIPSRPYIYLMGFSPLFLSGLGHARLAKISANTAFEPATGRQIELAMRADLRDRAHLITAPTLVVGMSQDQLVPVEHSRELHDAVPGSRYAELDSGHVVVHERPGELVNLLHGFMSD